MGQTATYSWQKLSGPGSSSILTPTSIQTQVTNLELGTHEFQLTVTDGNGRSGQDTVRVIVYDPRVPGAIEIVFKDLEWRCPWGCYLNIARFQGAAPDLSAINVFLRSGGEWMQIKSGSNNVPFFYSGVHLWEENGDLVIYSDALLGGRADVKIVF